MRPPSRRRSQGVCATRDRGARCRRPCRPRRARGAPGRHRAAVAGLRQLRHVSRLRTSRRCVRRRGPRRSRSGAAHERRHHVLWRARARAHAVRLGSRSRSGLVAGAAAGRPGHGHLGLHVDRRAATSAIRSTFSSGSSCSRSSGVLFAWVVTRVPAELWDKYSLALLLLGLLLLLLVLIPGLGAHGQRRAPLAAHRPDEFPGLGTRQGAGADLGVQLLRAQARGARDARCRDSRKPVGLLAVTALLLLLEPDFGAATVLFATGFAVLFVAGARLRYVLLLVSAAALAFAVLALTSAYRLKRLTGLPASLGRSVQRRLSADAVADRHRPRLLVRRRPRQQRAEAVLSAGGAHGLRVRGARRGAGPGRRASA